MTTTETKGMFNRPASRTHEVEVFLIVDARGDAAVGLDFVAAGNRYSKKHGNDPHLARRLIRITLAVPVEEVAAVTLDLPPAAGDVTAAVETTEQP